MCASFGAQRIDRQLFQGRCQSIVLAGNILQSVSCGGVAPTIDLGSKLFRTIAVFSSAFPVARHDSHTHCTLSVATHEEADGFPMQCHLKSRHGAPQDILELQNWLAVEFS